MALASDELQRLSEEIYTDRRITMSTYCARCGHNLLTLPYIYNCPECGNRYNARPLVLEGIFTPDLLRFPFSTLFGAVVAGGGSVLFVLSALGVPTFLLPGNPPGPPNLTGPPTSLALDTVGATLAAILILLTLIYVWLACRQVAQYIRSFALSRRIARAEADEE